MNSKLSLPAEQTARCPVVNSRILLSGAVPVQDTADQFVFRVCSNIDSCYNRPDIVEQIPDCLMHVLYKVEA